VFEGSYSTYKTSNLQKNISAFQKSANSGRGATACIVHNLPSTMSSNDENSLLRELRNLASSVFITGLSENYYAAFWEGWQGFVDDMAK
jgi:Spherulation-specific family 4